MKIQKKFVYILIFLTCFLFLPALNFIINDNSLTFNSKHNLVSSSNKNIEYLIITVDNYKSALETLAIWKTQKGLISKVVTVEEIEEAYLGRDLEEKIKNCIIDYYQNNNTQWVLLAGDNEHVSSRYAYAPENFPYDGDFVSCDSYYSDLDNNWDSNDDNIWGSNQDQFDFHAEVYVGRLSANTISEMNALINNIINYEKNPPIGSWMTEAMYAGAFIYFDEDWNDDGNPDLINGDRNQVGNYLAAKLPENWSYNTLGETSGLKSTDFPYNISLNPTNLENLINNGLGIGSIYGHGSPKSIHQMIWVEDYDGDGLFDYTDSPYTGGVPIDKAVFPTLFNITTANYNPNEKLGFYYLSGCSNGQFDDTEDCATEYFLKNAAIGCIGGSYVVWGEDNWTERAEGGWYSEGVCSRFFDYLFQYHRPGQALALAKEDYVSDRMSSGVPAIEPLWENKTLKQFNLLGDPEVPIWLNIPKRLELERTLSQNESETIFEVFINNNPIENTTITITNGIELIWRGKTNSTGQVNVPYAWNEISSYIITASKLKFLPDQISPVDEPEITSFSIPIILTICFMSVSILIFQMKQYKKYSI